MTVKTPLQMGALMVKQIEDQNETWRKLCCNKGLSRRMHSEIEIERGREREKRVVFI